MAIAHWWALTEKVFAADAAVVALAVVAWSQVAESDECALQRARRRAMAAHRGRGARGRTRRRVAPVAAVLDRLQSSAIVEELKAQARALGRAAATAGPRSRNAPRPDARRCLQARGRARSRSVVFDALADELIPDDLSAARCPVRAGTVGAQRARGAAPASATASRTARSRCSPGAAQRDLCAMTTAVRARRGARRLSSRRDHPGRGRIAVMPAAV